MQGMRRTLAYADPLWGTRQEETAPFSVGQPASLIEAAALRSTPEQKKLVEGMNATYTTLLDGFKARLADKDKRLEDKDKRLEDKDRLIDRLDKEIAALKEEIQNLKTRNIAGLP